MTVENFANLHAENVAKTMRQTMEELGGTEPLQMPDAVSPFEKAVLVSTPTHRSIQDLTSYHRKAAEYLKPARRKGAARLATLQSLIDWTNRFKGETSALFANPDESQPSLTCIANYHGEGAANAQSTDDSAQHCDHRGIYQFPLSKEWKKWMAVSDQALEKDQLGQFIEDNAKDILDPTPALLNAAKAEGKEDWERRMLEIALKIQGRFGQFNRLMELSRSFQVHETSNLNVGTNRDTGEATIQFVNEHKDFNGKPISIPNLFLIAIPVFESGALYRLPVRFRYRKNGGSVKFILSVYDPESAFKDAFDEAVKTAGDATKLPVFIGSPEA